jgi:hypothetical protein
MTIANNESDSNINNNNNRRPSKKRQHNSIIISRSYDARRTTTPLLVQQVLKSWSSMFYCCLAIVIFYSFFLFPTVTMFFRINATAKNVHDPVTLFLKDFRGNNNNINNNNNNNGQRQDEDKGQQIQSKNQQKQKRQNHERRRNDNNENDNDNDNNEQQQSSNARNAVMVLASVPLDKRHVTALWSELDCFTRHKNLKKVLISAPIWSKSIILRIVDEVKLKIPQFMVNNTNNNTTFIEIEANFFRNDHYDVGLWCDGLQSLGINSIKNNNNNNNNNNNYDDVILLNDSLFALRPFTSILDALRDNNDSNNNNNNNSAKQQNNIHMTSLSYSLTDPDGIWLESVFRGFDSYGIQKYMNHSCQRSQSQSQDNNNNNNDPATFSCFNIPDQLEKKRCIVKNYEIHIARLFANNTNTNTNNKTNTNVINNEHVKGLYLSDVPKDMWKLNMTYMTWTRHVEYWKDILVNKYNFPAAKVSKRNMIRTIKDPLIQQCTSKLNINIFDIESNIFNFSIGVRTVEKKE